MAQIKLGEALVQAGLIDEYQLKSALGQQRKWGGRLGKALIDLGFIDETTLLSFLSERLKFSAVDLSRSKIAQKTFAAVPKRVAEKYMVVPVLVKDTPGKKTLVLAMADPTDLKAIDEIEFLTNYRIEPVVALESSIKKVLQRYGMPDDDNKEEEEVGIALEEAPRGRVEIVHGDLDQMIEVQKQYKYTQQGVPPPLPTSSLGKGKIEGEKEFDFSASAQKDGEWLGEKEEDKHEDTEKLEFTPYDDDEIGNEAEIIQEAESIEEAKAMEEIPETQSDEGEMSAEVHIAQTIEDAAKFYEAHQEKAPPTGRELTMEESASVEAETSLEEAEICEPCDEEPTEETPSTASLHTTEEELQTEEANEMEAYTEEVVEEKVIEAVYSAQPVEEAKNENEYEYDVSLVAEAVEEESESMVADAVAKEVDEGYIVETEALNEPETQDVVYEAEAVESQIEPEAEATESPDVVAVIEEVEESPLMRELGLLREQITELKKQIEGLIMLFVLKEEGKMSLKDFLKEIKNL